MNGIRKTIGVLLLGLVLSQGAYAGQAGSKRACAGQEEFHELCSERYESGKIIGTRADLAKVKQILVAHPEYAQHCEGSESDALDLACRYADVAMVKLLAHYYKKNNFIDRKYMSEEGAVYAGKPYIMTAAISRAKPKRNIVAVIKELLKHGADPYVFVYAVSGDCNAFTCATRANPEALKVLLEHARKEGKLNKALETDNEHAVKPMECAIKWGSLASVKLLSAAHDEAGLNFDIPTDFYRAVPQKKKEAVAKFLQQEWEFDESDVDDVIGFWGLQDSDD